LIRCRAREASDRSRERRRPTGSDAYSPRVIPGSKGEGSPGTGNAIPRGDNRETRGPQRALQGADSDHGYAVVSSGWEGSMSGHRERVIGQNEAMFRRFNEMVEDVALLERSGGETAFLCECGDENCNEEIRLEPERYEAIRAVSTHFVVRPGHFFQRAEVVVEQHSGYWVVEKRGEAADEATKSDPRS